MLLFLRMIYASTGVIFLNELLFLISPRDPLRFGVDANLPNIAINNNAWFLPHDIQCK